MFYDKKVRECLSFSDFLFTFAPKIISHEKEYPSHTPGLSCRIKLVYRGNRFQGCPLFVGAPPTHLALLVSSPFSLLFFLNNALLVSVIPDFTLTFD